MAKKKPTRPGRSERRQSGKQAADRASAVAKTLMALGDVAFEALELDEDTRYEAAHARRIKSNIARRREERSLAGFLRGRAIESIEAQLVSAKQAVKADARPFKLGESWRARLIEEHDALSEFLETFADEDPARWRKLIDDARHQRDTGAPRGAAKLLFRQIMATLVKHPSADAS